MQFYSMLPAFRDKRYITVGGRPLFVIFAPGKLPEPKAFIDLWNTLARREGLPGFYFVAQSHYIPNVGFDASVANAPFVQMLSTGVDHCKWLINVVLDRLLKTDLGRLGINRMPHVHQYRDFVRHFSTAEAADHERPLLIPNWDNTPRSGTRGWVLHGSTPELFEEMCVAARTRLDRVKDPEQRLVFVKAWNEWAEGNHLEPDLLYGRGYLEALKRGLNLQARQPG